MKTTKEIFDFIKQEKGLSQNDIVNLYNSKFKTDIKRQSLNRMVASDNIKFSFLVEILSLAGYEITLKKINNWFVNIDF